MPDYQKELNISKLRRRILSMIAPALSKNARFRVSTYLMTNKISINESRVIFESVLQRLICVVVIVVSVVLIGLPTIWGNAWVAIPFFYFLFSLPISFFLGHYIIPRGRESVLFKNGEIIPYLSREFKKQFPDTYSELDLRHKKIIDNHIAEQDREKSLRKKLSFLVLIYRNWTIILLCIVIILLIWGTYLHTSKY